MFHAHHFTYIVIVFQLSIIPVFTVKCYSCYRESCPNPWNSRKAEKISSPTNWCFTYSFDNRTEKSIYARNWATTGLCEKSNCQWRTNSTGASFYVCCCNTDLCNHSNGKVHLSIIIQFIFIVYFFISSLLR